MAFMENDPLAAYLDALARDVCYRVDEVLKTAPHETTEVVYFVGANAAELGPFVRKRIAVDAAMGDAYGHLFQAQRAGRRFRHLPRIYDVHTTGNELVVVMEYIQGRTLRDEVYERDGSVALAAQWFPLLCDGVMELHEQFSPPLIHRDLKPTNIVVSDAGLTIIDFGIARAFREGAAGDTAHFGTRCYAPPEQFGYGQTDERSDVYALGMLLYYLLAERDPSPSVAAAGFAGPEVPFALRPVLQRACAFDPAARFQTVRDLKAAFLAALAPAGASPADRGVVVTQVAGAGRVSPADWAAPAGQAAPVGRAAPAGQAAPVGGDLGRPWAATAVSAAAPIDDRPHGVVVSRVRRAFSTLSSGETAGLVVDVALLVVWLLFMAVLIAMPFTPDERYAAWPFWLLAFQYWTFGIPFFTGLLFILTDVRVLRRAAPRLRLLQGARLRILGIVLVVAGVIAVGVTMAIANAMGLPTGS